MDIGIAARLAAAELERELAAILPDCTVAVVDTYEAVLGVSADVLAIRSDSGSEYPTGISLHAELTPGSDRETWLREVSRCLSEHLHVRTIFDGSPFGDSDAPVWWLVWDAGQALLADDSNSIFADSGDGMVRIVRVLPPDLFVQRLPLEGSVVRPQKAEASPA